MDERNEDEGHRLVPASSVTIDTIDRMLNEATDDSAMKDFGIARANLLTLIESGKTAMVDLLDLAKRSHHPQAYVALSKLIEIMIAANKALLEEQMKLRELKNVEVRHTAGRTIENGPKTLNQTAIFVGSTAQFQRAVGQLMKNIGSNDENNNDGSIEGDIE
jgi:replicative superfamily II helicase